jgi:hypothetical protein
MTEKFPACQPLKVVIRNARSCRRVQLITDSVNQGSLYGGVGTAVIMGALLARALKCRLRIVVRNERPNPKFVGTLLRAVQIDPGCEVEFAFAPANGSQLIDRSSLDLFLTTSWWTTEATIASVPTESVIYLLQEDERLFYPAGDDYVRCEQVLNHPRIKFLVNTNLLRRHLIQTGLTNLERNGFAFEPAFPPTLYQPPLVPSARTKKTLLFYARPTHARNLYYLGLQVLDAAVQRGLIDPNGWRIVFVGTGKFDGQFAGQLRPEHLGVLDWVRYCETLKSCDVGLCLMCSPHPSYPPLDLVASGAIAVTNRFGVKRDLSAYSENIILGDPTLEGMLTALKVGISKAGSEADRLRSYRSQSLCSDWSQAFAAVEKHLIENNASA